MFFLTEEQREKRSSQKMRNFVSLLLLLLTFIFSLSETQSAIFIPQSAPQSLIISLIQEKIGSCSYRVRVRTSCSSPSVNRDRIGVVFGDSHGNQIYEPRLDDGGSVRFGKCAVDNFDINGGCAEEISYFYLQTDGFDGWIPENVEISGSNDQFFSLPYNLSLPPNTWYGFNFPKLLATSPPPPPSSPPPPPSPPPPSPPPPSPPPPPPSPPPPSPPPPSPPPPSPPPPPPPPSPPPPSPPPPPPPPSPPPPSPPPPPPPPPPSPPPPSPPPPPPPSPPPPSPPPPCPPPPPASFSHRCNPEEWIAYLSLAFALVNFCLI